MNMVRKTSFTISDKEYIFLSQLSERRDFTTIKHCLSLLSKAVDENSYTFLNLPGIKESIITYIDWLILADRFNLLKAMAGDELSFDNEGFHLKGFIFSSLDEVEKAINNKAFL